MIRAENLEAYFARVKDYWSPLIIADMNDQYLKIAKVKGEFVWHQHEHEDELFYVVKGQLTISLRESTILLNQGDFYIVAKGIEHKPAAEQECWIMLIEPKTTAHTGKTVTSLSKSIEEQLRVSQKS
jgi:mannose-6-phosphate isomerase-like protein (cupin superfamily)